MHSLSYSSRKFQNFTKSIWINFLIRCFHFLSTGSHSFTVFNLLIVPYFIHLPKDLYQTLLIVFELTTEHDLIDGLPYKKKNWNFPLILEILFYTFLSKTWINNCWRLANQMWNGTSIPSLPHLRNQLFHCNFKQSY